MKILIINPNSSQIITNTIYNEAKKFQNMNEEISVKKAETGPKAIETNYDEVIGSTFVINKFRKEEEKYDAGIIGCFSDPGLDAVREIVNIPVVGMAESAIHMACLHGSRFSFIATGDAGDISVFYEIARRYGVESRLASVRCLSVEMEEINKSKKELIKTNIERCVYEDGANVVILGCAAFAGFGEILTSEMKIPVFDGVKESISFAKMLVDYNYKI